MFVNRKLMYGVALTMCLLLILSTPVVRATTGQEHSVASADVNAPTAHAAGLASPASLSSSADVPGTRANLESVKGAAVAVEREVLRAETTANGVSRTASQAEVPATVAPTSEKDDDATTSSSSDATTDAEDYGPIITGSVITGLVVVLCFAGVLTLLVLVEIYPHVQRWIRACRGESETDKTEAEITADRAVELAARERVEQALHREGGKDKMEPYGGVETTSVVQ